MNEHEKFLKTIVEKIGELQSEKKSLDEKIAALELAYETITGAVAPQKEKAKPADGRKGRTLDPEATEKTLALLQSRKRAVAASSVASHFKISSGAARQRLTALVKLGWAERVEKGKYKATTKGVKHAEIVEAGGGAGSAGTNPTAEFPA